VHLISWRPQGRGWWRKQDKPWQCLAACVELASALRSPDPTAYASRLPIQLDGTCNGLQHYAALGRDVGAATAVSLQPGPVPGDVYTAIAKRVEGRIDAEIAQADRSAGAAPSRALSRLPDDAPLLGADGDEDALVTEADSKGEASLMLARLLQGKIKRKHVKQPVRPSRSSCLSDVMWSHRS
jgi:hypothetical protein